jgi:hypothetical protein
MYELQITLLYDKAATKMLMNLIQWDEERYM